MPRKEAEAGEVPGGPRGGGAPQPFGHLAYAAQGC